MSEQDSIMAKGLRNTTRTYVQIRIPQEHPGLDSSVMWPMLWLDIGRSGASARERAGVP